MNVPDIQWCPLGIDSIEGDPSLCEAIRKFQALPNSAGGGAQQWLQARLDEQSIPFETHLALAPDSGDVLGFYALKKFEMNLSKDDSVKVRLRRLWDRNSEKRKQPGLEVCWIARDARTASDFGRNLFDHAVINAQEQDSVALVVTPHDEATAQLWVRNYHFMPFKDDHSGAADTPSRLWYPVDELIVGSWPS